MRRSAPVLSLFAALFVVAGCGGGSTPARPLLDLSFSGDLSAFILFDMAGKLGCSGYVACQTTCAHDPSTAATCITATCDPAVSANGLSRYNAALGCGQQYCAVGNDMGPARCMVAAGALVNLDGTTPSAGDPTNGSNPMKACYACLNDTLASLYGRSCYNATSADCNPPVCADDTQLCLDDKP